MIFVPCAHVVLVCNSCQQPCPAHIGRTLPALFFYTGWNTPNHSENDRGSRFAVNIRHCLRSFSLFYFVSRPIDFEKYILYRKGGTQNERTGKTQGNRAAHYTPRARQDPSRAICSIGCTMCAPGPSAPIASARGGAEDAGAHTAGTQGAGQHRKPHRAGMAGIPQAGG